MSSFLYKSQVKQNKQTAEGTARKSGQTRAAWHAESERYFYKEDTWKAFYMRQSNCKITESVFKLNDVYI